MNFIYVNNQTGRASQFSVSRVGIASIALVVMGLLFTMLFVGYRTALDTNLKNAPATILQASVEKQQAHLNTIQQTAEASVQALTIRLGEMQARVMRLDALGQRLTETANLDQGEFNFSEMPAAGGPDTGGVSVNVSSDDYTNFMADLENLTIRLADREQQLGVLEQLLVNQDVNEDVMPYGRPIMQGWLSSPFGIRKDPFNGKNTFHHGIDFAAAAGAPIVAVASGVVTWAGKRYGYGNMIEINHGNGYRTRYGHTDQILTRVGERVVAGEPVATVGSSGRSTGPHVHYEVLRRGRAINPHKLVVAKR